MNPFVNPNKRSITLPNGCKDLIDVLQRPESKHDSAVRQFIHLVLLQAQQDEASELIIGTTQANEETPIRYKIAGTWYDMSPFPSHIRRDVITEIATIARIPIGLFPIEGVLDVIVHGIRLRWVVSMMSADAECMLMRVQD
jgi:type II secretory ATPase GspE/PulE/Tfp pilus assembly ATPase PilB-like protein